MLGGSIRSKSSIYLSLRVEGIKEKVPSWITLKGGAHYAKKFFFTGTIFLIHRLEARSSLLLIHARLFARDGIRQLRLELIPSREIHF